MLTLPEKIIFVVMVLGSLALTYVTFGKMARIIFRGQGRLHLDEVVKRGWTGLKALVTQGNILRRRPLTSFIHYGVAWSFLFYFLVNAADVLEGFIADFEFLGDSAAGNVYRLLADLFTISAIIAVIYFVIRRFISEPQTLKARENVTLLDKARAGIPKDSALVAAFILIHAGFRFLGQTFLVAQEADAWQPFASVVSGLWSGLSADALNLGWHISFWVALGAIIAFLPYFPYTKHAHLFMGPLNFTTRPKRRSLGALNPLDFEDETIEQFGASRLTDLSQTQILDAFACIMCNRCQEACPAYATGKELSPATLEINKRYYIRKNMDELAAGGEDSGLLMDYAISESAVWACTACGACVDVCPVGNEPMFDILHIRQNQVLMESSFPQELKGAFNGMERMGNPWGLTEDRLAWAEPLDFDVPTVADNPDFDVLYWVGCAGAFDPNAQEIARAMATVLHAAEVNYAVLGNDETCTGDSARRAGNEYLFFEMAMMNIETLNELNVPEKRVVTTCPHCFHTIAKEYPALGGNYQVLHHTQMIADLVGKGQLSLKNGNELSQTTFHDPCYLGRHNDIVDPPGAQMWKEEEHGEQAVSMARFEEAQKTGAKTLAVGCPFCARMLSDANTEAGESMVVKDVAQMVAEQIS